MGLGIHKTGTTAGSQAVQHQGSVTCLAGWMCSRWWQPAVQWGLVH